MEWEDRIFNAAKLDPDPKQSWEELPQVVKRYFMEALGVSSPLDANGMVSSVQALRFSQTGTFQGDPKKPWTAFSANQVITTNPPAFVWDASIAMFPFLSRWPMVQICDAWTKGKAGLMVALMNVIELPTVPPSKDPGRQQEMDRALEVGEAMRWLAEAVLVPTSLLPTQGLVVWSAPVESDNGSDQAILRLHDSFEMPEAKLVVTFDRDTGFPKQIDGFRPKWLPASQTFEVGTWQGFFEDFQKLPLGDGAIIVPTHLQVGWVNPSTGALELYFDGFNRDLALSVNVLPKDSEATTLTAEVH